MAKHTLRRQLQTTAAVTALSLAMAGYAGAQDGAEDAAPDAAPESITVTGIRAAVASALEAKRENTSIVEAITAEDIGKLPDLSIADSLARLPGVTAQRVRGRAQQVSIRGLGPDFSLALLNGREVVSAGNNRGIEFDQFPSELISSGIVYKTPDARLAATGIAGAVDLRTLRPLDYDDRQVVVSGRYVWNDQDQLNPDFDEDGYRLFGSIIDQNEEGTLGWNLGITLQSNPTQFTSRELKTDSGQTATDAGTGLLYPSDNPRTGVVSREFERTSVVGALQFEPTDTFQATLDVFYGDTQDNGIFRGVETPLATWAGVSGPSSISGDAGQGFGSSIVYDGVAPILRTDEEGNSAEIFAIGLNTSYDLTDRLTLTGDISHSTLDRNDIDYESYAGRGGQIVGSGRDPNLVDTLTYTLRPDGDYSIGSTADYTDPNQVFLTDPGGWGQVGFIKEPIIEDDLTQLRAEAEYAVDRPFISSVVGGVLYNDREKNFDSNEGFLRNNDSWTLTDPTASTSQRFLTIPGVLGATNSGSIGLPIIAYDTSSFISDGTYTYEKATFDTEWTVAEEILTLYAMANIDGQLGQIPVRGNVGFQYVDTEQTSTAELQSTEGGSTGPLTNEFDDFLPSLNLTFEVVPDFLVRTSVAKTLTRVRLDQLAANQTLATDPRVCTDTDGDQRPDAFDASAVDLDSGITCYALSGGNPFLRPYQSTSYDLAFEKYFDSSSSISVALFYKDLSDWVETVTGFIDVTEQVNAIGDGPFLTANPDVALGRISVPVNFFDGDITGIEATVNWSLDDVLPPSLEGFGFFASYTYADAGLTFEDGTDIPIPGYSDTVWAANVYYENHGFRARLSGRHRSEFESEIQNFDGSLSGSTALEETIWDAQLGYEFAGGALDGFTVLFEAFNITDEPFVTVGRGTDFPSRFEEYGTTYNVAVSKKF